MKTIASHAKVLGFALTAVLFAPLIHAQSAAIAVDRTQYFNQTDSSTVMAPNMPVSLNFNIRGGVTNMSAWGPAFYKPGSGGVPQSGSSTATNTGTLNFSASPNNGGDYMFVHDFASTADLAATYPNGDYGVKFLGSGAPSPSTFTAGLTFANSAYPTATPQVTSVDNGATWTSGVLQLAASGVTTFSLNTFSEYNTATYGAIIGVGIYQSATGNVVGGASAESYNLPMGDSSATPAPHYDAPITQFSVDSSWLTPGVAYTIEIHYTLLSGRPEEANLNGQEFQGVASSRKITTIAVSVVGTAPQPDFNQDGNADILFRNPTTGEVSVWFMNGATRASSASVATSSTAWQVDATGDFNSDGDPDIIWRNPSTGEASVWFMDGITRLSSVSIATSSTAWQINGTGDFNGDGKPDIVWRNPTTGEASVWFMNGVTRLSSVALPTSSTAWQINGTGDFNKDGKVDLIWRNPSTGETAIWFMNGVVRTSSITLGVTSTQWIIAGTRDLNRDGQIDILWRNQSSGDISVWFMDGATRTSSISVGTASTAWQIVGR